MDLKAFSSGPGFVTSQLCALEAGGRALGVAQCAEMPLQECRSPLAFQGLVHVFGEDKMRGALGCQDQRVTQLLSQPHL